MADKSTVERWLRQMQSSRWTTAHNTWDTWMSMIKREFRPVIDPKMGALAAGADYRTAALEKELKRIVAFLSGTTRDIQSKAGLDSKTGEDEAKNAQLWATRFIGDIDSARWADEVMAADIGVPGVGVMRLLTQNLEEPEDMDREEWMQSRDSVWYLRHAQSQTCFWEPIDTPYTRILMDYELPVSAAYESMKTEGSRVGKDKGKHYVPIHDKEAASGLRWVGDEEVETDGQLDNADHHLRVTVAEYRDASKPCPICPDKHPLWVGVEVVRGTDKKITDGDVVNEYVLPYKHWPTLRVVEGETWPGQNDPLWRYRPMMFDLLNEAGHVNWYNAMLSAIANWDMTKGDLVQLNNTMPEEARQLFDRYNISLEIEPNTVDDKADLVPGQPVRWPAHVTGELIDLKRDAELRFERAKINPILFGEQFDEARQAPGTTYAMALRQSRLGFDRPNAHIDQFYQELIEDVFHAMLYWDHEEGKDTEQRYYVNLMGDEGSGGPGEKVYESASRLSTRPRVQVVANAEQLAEQQARHEAAWNDYLRGIKSWEQLLEEFGYKDVEAQIEVQNRDRQARQLQPLEDNMTANYTVQMLADLTDTDPMWALQNPLAAPTTDQRQPAPTDVRSAAPTIRPPALSGPANGPSPTGAQV